MNSILNQTFTNWECIIVDDGSEEIDFLEIENFSKKDHRFKFYKRPSNELKGANACRNYGVKKSKGEFLFFFDSDDLMDVRCLENRINSFRKYSEFDFLVFSMGHFIKETDCYLDKNRKSVNLTNKKTIEEFVFSEKLPWNVCRPIFKRNLIKNKIWFNEKMQNFQDDEFNIRVLANLNPKYKSIDITDSYYRMEESNINKYLSLKGRQNILDSFYEYSKTIFDALEMNQINNFRNKLLLRFFSVLRANISNKTDLKDVYKTIFLFKERLKLTYKEILMLKLVIFFNKYYFNKKGYFKITQYFKSVLINLNEN